MNSQEAKDILQLCRPGHSEDLDDPLIAGALKKLEQDSSLSAWFEEQTIVDAEISAELGLITPPSGLKQSILKGMQERLEQPNSHAENLSREDNPHDPATEPDATTATVGSTLSWFRPWIGIAAILLFASVLLVILNREPAANLANSDVPTDALTTNSIATVANVPDIIQFLGQQITDFKSSKFDKRSEQIQELQSHLALAGMPNPTDIPNLLEATPTIGCVTFDYNGTKMSMICFKNGKVYHLITMDKGNLGKNDLLDGLQSGNNIFEHQQKAFKVWSEENQIYILCTEGTKEEIPEFI